MDDTLTVFALTPDHIKLLHRMYVSWDDCEFGAPAIDPKRPYGNSDVCGDMAEILGMEPADNTIEPGYPCLSEQQEDELTLLHRETKTALQIVLDTGRMEPGPYQRELYGGKWHKLGDAT